MSKKLNTSPISGMQELLPAEQAIFNSLKRNIEEVYHSHGFQFIETPIIDRTEILFAKAGGDTEKQIYRVFKTAETADSADQALRFDHTVPLARYVVEHESSLTFPFRVSQIGRNFRGERAQKGRFREFYQCDIDILGRGSLPLVYDAEVISTYVSAIKSMHLPDIIVRIGNRKLLSGFLEELALTNLSAEIFGIIDHAEKVSKETTREFLDSLHIGSDAVEKILDFINIHGTLKEVKSKLEDYDYGGELYAEGLNELLFVLKSLESSGLEGVAIADMMIVRGLDYYTGTVFEAFFRDYRTIGAIGGGGRYENLTKHFSDQVFAGVGASIGLSRLFYIVKENNLLDFKSSTPLDYCLIPFSEKEYSDASALAEKLRERKYSVDINFSGKKLGDKLSYASKVATFAVVIGEDEVKSGIYEQKNLLTGEKSKLDI